MKKIVHRIFTMAQTLNRYKLYEKIGVPFKEYRQLFWSSKVNRKSRLFNKSIVYTDKFWYKHGLQELFIDKTYWFKANSETPLILDCGANIGLSIIYFKKLYPKARVIGFEPDQKIFGILKENLAKFDFKDVILENKAVWITNDFLNFRSDDSVGGNLVEAKEPNGLQVETARLRDYLDQQVDFLKIDIEGAEYAVLKDCRDQLRNVDNMFVEYHSTLKDEQQLSDILLILKEAGFRCYIKEAWENMKYPYMDKKGLHFDLQLNIFGYRI